jgi:hypothetical protein
MDDEQRAAERRYKADPTDEPNNEHLIALRLRKGEVTPEGKTVQRLMLEHIIRLERGVGVGYTHDPDLPGTAQRFMEALLTPVSARDVLNFMDGKFPKEIEALRASRAAQVAAPRDVIQNCRACGHPHFAGHRCGVLLPSHLTVLPPTTPLSARSVASRLEMRFRQIEGINYVCGCSGVGADLEDAERIRGRGMTRESLINGFRRYSGGRVPTEEELEQFAELIERYGDDLPPRVQ